MSELEVLKRRIERERKARKAAEKLLEEKALELYQVNQELKKANFQLEAKIEKDSLEFLAKEEKYKKLVEEANDLICNFDLQGNFTYLNTVAENTLGASKNEIIGKNFSDFISPDHLHRTIELLKSSYENNQATTYVEFPLKSINGKTIWLGQNTNLVKDDKGEYYFSVIARDITKQKEAEYEILRIQKKLISSELKFRSIIENMELGLLELTQEGVITKAHPFFCQMVGYNEQELKGRKLRELIISSSNPEEADNLIDAAVVEHKLRKKTGDEIWVLSSSARFGEQESDEKGLISIFYDLTTIKNLQFNLIESREKAVRAQHAQRDFLANISHEIQTPLNAIVGMSHLISETRLSKEQLEMLEQISGSGYILKSLIADLLDKSKIDSGIMEVKSKPFDLSKLFITLQKAVNIKTVGKDLQVIYEIDDRINCSLIGDEMLLNQILLNLISNAIKFTSSGKVIISAQVLSQTADLLTLNFEVTDTGIGIEEKDLERIFQAYEHASTEIKKNYGGTGLGLSITKKLVELLGGQLEVESKPNEGSRFYFSLNLKKGPNALKTILDAPIKTRHLIQDPILIVEDNALNQNYIIKLLEKWKLQYVVAANGLDALSIIKTRPFSLILMDLQMPIMDGFEATKKIRAFTDPTVSKIPIIAITASTLINGKKDAINAGMNEYLTKPFTPSQLADTIDLCLQNHFRGDVTEIQNEHSSSHKQLVFIADLDQHYLHSIYDDDAHYATEMFEIFVESVPGEIDELIRKITNSEFEKVYQIAHKIKPTFAMVGLTKAHKMLSELEETAKVKGNIFAYRNELITIKEVRINIVQEQLKRLKNQLSISKS